MKTIIAGVFVLAAMSASHADTHVMCERGVDFWITTEPQVEVSRAPHHAPEFYDSKGFKDGSMVFGPYFLQFEDGDRAYYQKDNNPRKYRCRVKDL